MNTRRQMRLNQEGQTVASEIQGWREIRASHERAHQTRAQKRGAGRRHKIQARKQRGNIDLRLCDEAPLCSRRDVLAAGIGITTGALAGITTRARLLAEDRGSIAVERIQNERGEGNAKGQPRSAHGDQSGRPDRIVSTRSPIQSPPGCGKHRDDVRANTRHFVTVNSPLRASPRFPCAQCEFLPGGSALPFSFSCGSSLSSFCGSHSRPMTAVPSRVGDALWRAFRIFWEIPWALSLVFLLSAIVQTVVSNAERSRPLPDGSPKTIAKACGWGAASSSCSMLRPLPPGPYFGKAPISRLPWRFNGHPGIWWQSSPSS